MILAVISAWIPIHAQIGLKINEFFTDKFQYQPDVTSIDMQGAPINNQWGDLVSLYRSVTVTKPHHVNAIQSAVKADGVKATSRTATSTDGHISYGWYCLPKQDGVYRYIILLSPPENDKPTILIYIEGRIEPLAFKQLILKKIPLEPF